jgi:predicted DNA-binding ribbon-helix-helix protein
MPSGNRGNLSSAIRLFVLGDYRKQLSDLNGGNSPAEVEAATQTRTQNLPGTPH